MKKIWILFPVLIGFVTLTLSGNAFAIGRKPKTETEHAPLKAPRKPLPPPNARDMQVSTGQIEPIVPQHESDQK